MSAWEKLATRRGAAASSASPSFGALALLWGGCVMTSWLVAACREGPGLPVEAKESPEVASASLSPEAPAERLEFPAGGLVAHAMGAIDGRSYTNSKEAFEYNYGVGKRWFEVDFAPSREGHLFAFHPHHEKHVGLDAPFTEQPAAALERLKYRGKYPLLSLDQVFDLFQARPDAFLVTDTKRWTPAIAEELAGQLASRGPLSRRVIPQLYHRKDLEIVRAAAQAARIRYAGFIFTLYRNTLSDDEVAEFVREHQIPIVVLRTTRFSPWTAETLHAAGAKVVVHTLNGHEDIEQFAAAGADGFYTDSYLPRAELFGASAEVRRALRRPRRPRWRYFTLAQTDAFRWGSCVSGQDGRWLARRCGAAPVVTGPILTGPRRPAAGSVLTFRVQLRGSAQGGRARVVVASERGRKLYYESSWAALDADRSTLLAGQAALDGAASDARLSLFVEEERRPAADAGTADAASALDGVVIEDLAVTIAPGEEALRAAKSQ